VNIQVLVLAKAPVPGLVKTRLCPPCTPAQAAAVAAAALLDTADAVSATDVADSGVTATTRTCSSGLRETSWIESTAPSEATQSRGSNRSLSACRAYSIDEIQGRGLAGRGAAQRRFVKAESAHDVRIRTG